MRGGSRWLLLAGLLGVGGAALAFEGITYRYDARGRLIRVERSGGVNDGITTNYSYDKADNRTRRRVTGVK